jgi:hypothetical protein
LRGTDAKAAEATTRPREPSWIKRGVTAFSQTQ